MKKLGPIKYAFIRLNQICAVCLFLSGFSTNAQVLEKVNLSNFLEQLEVEYGYKFNYPVERVSEIELVPPETRLPFQQVLAHIYQTTGLRFSILSEDIVILEVEKTLFFCGILRDISTGAPISQATLRTSDSTVVTDENGYFQIAVTQTPFSLLIEHIAYQKRRVSILEIMGDCQEIFLQAEEVSLSTVLISTYLVKGIDQLRDGTLEIDFSQFSILPGLIETDVLQSVQSLPGIQSIDETISNINIRGGTNDQNLVLWDGIKMYQSGHFFGLISAFNPQITQKVSLLKNGTNAQYTDGVSGTLLMTTDEALNRQFSGTIGVNFISADAFVDIPLGSRSSLQVAGRKSLNNLIQTPTYDEYFERISQDSEAEINQSTDIATSRTFSFFDTSLRWLYHLSPTDRLRLNFITFDNDLAFDEVATLEDALISRESSINQNSIAAGLQYQKDWSDRFFSQLDLYETDYKLEATNVAIEADQRFFQKNQVSETGIKWSNSFRLTAPLTIEGGYQFVETEVTNVDDVDNPRFRRLISEVVRTHALFVGARFRESEDNTIIILGVRANYIDKFDKTRVEPRLRATQKLSNTIALTVAGELKHQNTSQIINFQNDFLGLEKRRWQLANNEDIPVIESKQASLGLTYKKSGWLLDITGYLKKVEGITTQSQGFQTKYEFVRTDGSYQVHGIDALLRKRIAHFSTWISYSWMDNEYTFRALEDPFFPNNFDITHAISSGVTYAHEQLKVGLGFNYRTGKPYTKPIEATAIENGIINYAVANSTRLNEYMRIDASAMYSWKFNKRRRGEIGVSVWNLLDKENAIDTFYNLLPDNTIQQARQQSLGLTTNVVLRYYF